MIFKKPEMLFDFEVTLKVKLFFIFVQNKCVPYWPELHSTKEVGRYVVSCESEREAGDYKIRVLTIAPMDQVTYKHQTLTSLRFLISAHLIISPGFDLSCFPPILSQNMLVKCGTTSTSAGQITASLRRHAVSSASSLK